MKFCVNVYINNLKNPIEFQGHTSKVKVTFLAFFCVRDTAATRGQYLALSKAWRSSVMRHMRDGSAPFCELEGQGAKGWPAQIFVDDQRTVFFELHHYGLRNSSAGGAEGVSK